MPCYTPDQLFPPLGEDWRNYDEMNARSQQQINNAFSQRFIEIRSAYSALCQDIIQIASGEGQNSSKITALSSRLDTAQNNIAALQKNMGDLQDDNAQFKAYVTQQLANWTKTVSDFQAMLTTLQNQVAQNTSDIVTLKGQIDPALWQKMTDAFSNLQKMIDNSISTYDANVVQPALSKEANTRQAADTNLQNEITTISGQVSDLSTTVSKNAASASTSISSLNKALNDETARATSAEGGNTALINSEVTRAKSAESALSVTIQNETTRAENQEVSLNSSLQGTIAQVIDYASNNNISLNTLQGNNGNVQQLADYLGAKTQGLELMGVDGAKHPVTVLMADTSRQSIPTQLAGIQSNAQKAIGIANEAQAAVSAETTRAVAAEASNSKDIIAENLRAIAAENALAAGVKANIKNISDVKKEADGNKDSISSLTTAFNNGLKVAGKQDLGWGVLSDSTVTLKQAGTVMYGYFAQAFKENDTFSAAGIKSDGNISTGSNIGIFIRDSDKKYFIFSISLSSTSPASNAILIGEKDAS